MRHRSSRPGRTLSGLILNLLVIASLLFVWGTPASAQQTEAPQGILKVTATRPGAKVYLDNQPIGEAPLSRYVPVGEYLVRVAADGYDPFVRKVRVTEGTTHKVDARLLPGRGTVEFQVNAPGAMLIINGKDEWPLPVRLPDLAPGTYKFRIQARGYESIDGSFSFARGKNVLIVEQLKSSAGLISVHTSPEQARVWLDGEDVGASPVDLEGVEAGVHTVRVELDGYATLIRQVDTTDGSKGVIDARLADHGGKLIISTGRADAQITVNGLLMGTGKVLKIKQLERGRYDIQVQAPGMRTASGRAKITPRGRSAYKVRFKEEGARGSSRLTELRPFYERWTFWAASGALAAGGATGAALAWKASQPVPVPDGDVVVSLP